MRFLSIRINNYRQYRDLALDFHAGEHDLQVIVADNGVGKTNLLNAFTWCLYGIEPHLGTSQMGASRQKLEPKLNKEVIAECTERHLSIADVRVQVDIEDGEGADSKIIRVTRTVPFSISRVGTFFEKTAETRLAVVIIRKGGSDHPLEGEMAQEYINMFLPESIRRYFFFDGEQLNSYFQANNGDRIKEAVYSISRIDLIRLMIDRLDNVVKIQRRNAAAASSDTEGVAKKLEEKEQTLAGALNFIEEKKREISELDQKITEIDDQLRGVPNIGELERRCSDARKKRDAQRDRVANAEAAYYRFARERVVDFYLYPIASASLQKIRELQDDGQLPPSIDRARLAEALREGKCMVCGHELDENDKEKIRGLLELFKVGSRTSNILSSMVSDLDGLQRKMASYPSDRKRHVSDLDDARKTLDELEDELKELEASAAKFAETGDGIKKLYEDRAAFRRQRDECVRLMGTRQSTIDRLETDVRKGRKLLSDSARKSEKAASLNRMVEFGNRALDVLKRAEASVIEETRVKMAERTEQLFRNLVWKESKCDRIELSDNYTPSLFDKDGFSCAGTCSAAERSLLALSFTLAMHEVSGFDSPLFIDTPIARASGENRENFARTLVEVSEGKQLVLAFTPDEYSESIQKEFEPAISTYIRLRLDPDETHVMEPEVENRDN